MLFDGLVHETSKPYGFLEAKQYFAAGEISRNALVRKTQFLSKREREEIFDALVEGELIARSVKQTGTKPTMLFTPRGTPEVTDGKEASP
jgi:hypothetical protein